MEQPTASGILILMLLLQLKHAIGDGPLQTRWMLGEKGRYGASGGLVHALIHGVGSLLALVVFGAPTILSVALAAVDGVTHYHVDYLKEQVVKRQGWTHTDTYFWWALAADQTLHHLTYFVMASVIVSSY